MKKAIFTVLSLLVVAVFLVGCSPKEVPNEKVDAELQELSNEELDQVIKEGGAEEGKALAGQASQFRMTRELKKVQAPTNQIYRRALVEKNVRLEAKPELVIKDWSVFRKFGLIKDLVAFNTYCLDKYSFVLKQQEGTLCWEFTQSDSGTLEGKKIMNGYKCSANPIPNKEDLCPEGTLIGSDDFAIYNCYGSEPFQASCLSGYDTVHDWSQNKPSNNPYYAIRCVFNFTTPSQFRDPSIPCGTSGARVHPPGVFGDYCCVYLEE